MNLCRLLPLAFILLSFSCAPGGRKTTVAGVDSAKPRVLTKAGNANNDILPRWKTLDTPLYFAGVWVNEIYFEKIASNRSPRNSQGLDKSCIKIPDSTLEATNMVGGFHEGAATMVVVKEGSRYQFYDPALKIPGDTIESMGAHRLRIGDQYFRRLEHPDMDKPDWGILEEILFSGRYQRENGSEVVFHRDGFITGLDSITYYDPTIDYTAIEYWQLDQISLGRTNKKLNTYTFRWNADTLSICRIDCMRYFEKSQECDSAIAGATLWKLRKVGAE